MLGYVVYGKTRQKNIQISVKLLWILTVWTRFNYFQVSLWITDMKFENVYFNYARMHCDKASYNHVIWFKYLCKIILFIIANNREFLYADQTDMIICSDIIFYLQQCHVC
jgi:hypothetical protein